MLAGERGNDWSLLHPPRPFTALSIQVAHHGKEREHFWSCSAPQDGARALMRGKTDQRLQSCQQVVSYLGVQRISAHCSWLWLQTLLQTLSNLQYLFKHASFWSFNLIWNLSESKAVSKNYIKFIKNYIKLYHFLSHSGPFLFKCTFHRFFEFWKISVIIQIWSKNSTIWGRNSHDTLKETWVASKNYFFTLHEYSVIDPSWVWYTWFQSLLSSV